MPTAATTSLLTAPPSGPRAPSATGPAGTGRGPGTHPAGRGAHRGASLSSGEAEDFLARLRAAATDRAPVDPGLAGGLRAWLEDGAATAGRRERGIRIGPGPAAEPGSVTAGRDPGASASARRLLARAVFRLVVGGHPPRHPFEDALCALSVTGTGDAAIATVQAMARHERAALRGATESDAATIVAQWRRPPPAWLARPAERLHVPLAAGDVTLEATVDLALGTPSHGVASVCLVEVRAGPGAPPGPGGRRFLALAETLRSGAPPCTVATYDAASGSLDVDEVDETMLVAAVGDVLSLLDGAGRPPAAR